MSFKSSFARMRRNPTGARFLSISALAVVATAAVAVAVLGWKSHTGVSTPAPRHAKGAAVWQASASPPATTVTQEPVVAAASQPASSNVGRVRTNGVSGHRRHHLRHRRPAQSVPVIQRQPAPAHAPPPASHHHHHLFAPARDGERNQAPREDRQDNQAPHDDGQREPGSTDDEHHDGDPGNDEQHREGGTTGASGPTGPSGD